MPATVREKLNPNTIRKELAKTQTPHSQLSARALDSYAQTRASDVSRDYQAGTGWHSIVRGLSSLEPALTGMLERQLDRDIEEGVATGRNIFTTSDEELRNKQTFKQFVEAHPEYANDNPYVWKGWEAARLNSLALDYDKGLQDMYTESGLKNERDTGKVTKAVDEFNKEFRRQFALDKYENPIDLAQHFTKYAAQSRAAIISRHAADIKAQAEENLAMATMERAAKQVELMVGPAYGGKNGMPNIALASQQGAALDRMYQVFVNNLTEASMNGLRNDKIPGHYMDMVLSAYHKYDENPAILKLLDREVNGVTPSSLPGVQAKLSQLEQQRIAKNFSAWQRAKAHESYAREQEIRQGKEAGVNFILNGGGILTLDTPLNDKGETLRTVNMSPLAKLEFIKNSNEMAKAFNTSRKENPDWQNAVSFYEIQASLGLIPLDEAMAKDAELVTGGSITKKTMEAKSTENEAATNTLKDGAARIFKAMTGSDLASFDFDFNGTVDKKYLEANQMLMQFYAEGRARMDEIREKSKGKLLDTSVYMSASLELVDKFLTKAKNKAEPWQTTAATNENTAQGNADALAAEFLRRKIGRVPAGKVTVASARAFAATKGQQAVEEFDHFMATGGQEQP